MEIDIVRTIAMLDKSLNEAERLFKNNRYKRAIEIAELSS